MRLKTQAPRHHPTDTSMARNDHVPEHNLHTARSRVKGYLFLARICLPDVDEPASAIIPLIDKSSGSKMPTNTARKLAHNGSLCSTAGLKLALAVIIVPVASLISTEPSENVTYLHY